MVSGNMVSVISWTSKKGIWVLLSHEQWQLVLMLKARVLGCSCSTSHIWEWDGEVPALKPAQWNPSQAHAGPSGPFYILWDGVKWRVIIAFYIYPSKYFPGHHREGSTNYSYKINLWKCFMSWFWWWVTRVCQICHSSDWILTICQFYYM